MKNILIIGDSWGVPFYTGKISFTGIKYNNIYPEDHTHFQLEKFGYKVFNYSLNNGSNFQSIEYARHSIHKIEMSPTLKNTIQRKRDTYVQDPKLIPVPDYQGEKIDFIIWFHSEPVRTQSYLGSPYAPYVKFEELLDINCKIDYRAFVNLYNSIPNVKTVVIGGQAPVHPSFLDYHRPDFFIKDWRSELVNKQLPECYSTSRTNLINVLADDLEIKLNILNTHKEILDAMTDENIFYDKCHPGATAHKQLASRLHDWFLNN